MAKQNRQIYPVIDIGTQKTVVLVAVFQNNEIKAIYDSEYKHSGILKGGIITNHVMLAKCITTALSNVEKKIGRLQHIYASISGEGAKSRVIEGKSFLCSKNKGLQASDEKSAMKNLHQNRHVPDGCVDLTLHELPSLLDNKELPLGTALQKKTHFGEILTVRRLQVLGDEKHVRDLEEILYEYNTVPRGWFASGIASGRAMTSRDSNLRNRGVLVIDIGAGATDYTLYEKGNICTTGVLPIGGDHITSDLMEGLHLDRKTAEDLKCKHASAILREKKPETRLWTRNDRSVGDKEIYQYSMDLITHARMDELLQCIKLRLSPYLKNEVARAGIVLTGGASLLPGIDRLAMSVLGLNVRKPTYPAWVPDRLQHPKYSTALGLVEILCTQPIECFRETKTESFLKRFWRSLLRQMR